MLDNLIIFYNSFNNIELATIIIFIILIICIKNLRKIVCDLIKNSLTIICQHKILLFSFIILSLIWVITTYILYVSNFWNINLLKSCIFYFICSGLVIFYRITKEKDCFSTIKSIFLNYFSLSAAYEFIADIYTPPLLISLFLIIIVFIFAIIYEYSKDKTEYRLVKNFSNIVLSISGCVFLYFLIKGIITNFDTLYTITNLKDFLMPLLYAPGCILFSIICKIYSEYSNLIAHIKLRKYIGLQIDIINITKIFFKFNIDFLTLDEFKHFICSSNYFKEKNRNIKDILLEFDSRRLQQPFDKDNCCGFEINKIIKLLKAYSVEISSYRHTENDNGYGNYFSNGTKNLNLFDCLYIQIEGTNQCIQRIKIEYQIITHPKKKNKSNFDEYACICAEIYKTCFNQDIKINTKMFKNKNFSISNKFLISFEQKKYNKNLRKYILLFESKKPYISKYFTKT